MFELSYRNPGLLLPRPIHCPEHVLLWLHMLKRNFNDLLQENSPLIKGLEIKNSRLGERVKLLSKENEEMRQEYSILAKDIEAKTKEVMILEMRIKCLESQIQDEGNKSGDLSEEDEEETSPGSEELEMQSGEGLNKEELKDEKSDGESASLDVENEQGKMVNGRSSPFIKQYTGVAIEQKWEDDAASGEICPRTITNLKEDSDHVEQLQMMQNFIGKIANYLKIDIDVNNLQNNHHGSKGKACTFDEIEGKVWAITKENEHLKKETRELKSLVEFLELEQKFTREDFQESEEKYVNLQKRLEDVIKNEQVLQGQLTTWSNLCGKLYATVKKGKRKPAEKCVMQTGRDVAVKRARRNVLRQKCKNIGVQLKAYIAKANGSKRFLNAFADRNLELELKVDLLQFMNEAITDGKNELEQAYKNEIQANIRIHDELEGMREQRKEVDSIKLENFALLKNLKKEKEHHADSQRKLQVALVGKEVVQKGFEKEMRRYEDCKRKLYEVATEKADVKETLEKDIRAMLEEVKVEREQKEDAIKNLEGEMKIRFVYERKLEEYFTEKKILEKSLESEVKKNQEAKSIISTLYQIIETKKKKRSRFRRFFRRGSD